MSSFDNYTLKARVAPVIIVCLPALVLVGAGLVTGATLGIVTGATVSALSVLASQLGRDRGRALQPTLWQTWGGAPTLKLFRFNGTGHPDRVERFHRHVEDILGVELPSATAEAADPLAADAVYDEMSARLRGLTRDRSRFGLLFAENVNYGFRRNLLGLKRAGVVLACLTLILAVTLCGFSSGSTAHRLAAYGPAAATALLMLVGWWTLFTEQWVRLPADAYAIQFNEAVTMLHHDLAGPSRATE